MNQDSRTRRRLELMRRIREENHSNQQRIRTREEILYGKSSSYPSQAGYGGCEEYDEYGYPLSAAEYPGQRETRISTFGLRFFLAALLFALYFVCKTQDTAVFGINAGQLEAAVAGNSVFESTETRETDALTKVIDFISQFTYTLHDS